MIACLERNVVNSKIFLKTLALSVLLAACGQAAHTLGRQDAGDIVERDALMEILSQREHSKQVEVEKSPPFFNQAADSVAQTGFLANPNVQAFIQYQHQVNDMDMAYLNDFFERVTYRGNIIDIMNRPATSRPWYEFQKGNAGIAKINAGKNFYLKNQNIIHEVANKYGVPAEIIVAIIGIETNYGGYMGNIPVADALATLAFDYPRRAAFFQKELAEFLRIVQEEGEDAFSFKGSYAGAMGMPQFMPSSFQKWAVDHDGDGHRDIWKNVGDTAASVANYLKQHGWQTGGRMVVPVSLQITPQLQAIIDEKTALTYTVGQLRQMGVAPQQLVDDEEKVVLYALEVAPKQFEYYIGLNNFYAVWQYNHSRMYVTAVRDIANGIANSHW